MADDVPGVAFVAHCLLNQNSKVNEGAVEPGIHLPLVEVLREQGWKVEQMPCPELTFTGLNRFWAVKEQYDTAGYRRHCRTLAEAVAGAAGAYVACGVAVVLVGLEGSPSMGVALTSSSADWGGAPTRQLGGYDFDLVPGEGVFIEELRASFRRRGLPVPRAAGISHQVPGYDVGAARSELATFLRDVSATAAAGDRGAGVQDPGFQDPRAQDRGLGHRAP